MKLKSVHVRMYRNILDSSEVIIQPDATCLVGKNESGKTAFLQALWRLNPARTKPTFSVPDHYPAWLEKRHRNEGQDLDKVLPVEALYVFEDGDTLAIEKLFGKGVAPSKMELSLSKSYKNELSWTHHCDEKAAVQNFLKSQKRSSEVTAAVKGAGTFSTLGEVIAAGKAEHAEAPEVLAGFAELEAQLKAILGNSDFDGVLWAALLPRIPKFLYFAEYSKLPYSVKIATILKAADDKLKESEATARALLRLGGAEQEYLLNPDYERRKRELENVSNLLTDDVLKYWSQNNGLRVQPEITQRNEAIANGQQTVLDELKIRIWDNRHSLSLPFDQHSSGFQWFFSFLAAFSEYENQATPVVILLDEPAVALHAKAQADFLRFIDERLTKRCQVIYTTHSPFMVQPGHLERVRMVEDKGRDEGSTISSEVLSRDADTLFPLQGALGYDLVQHLFVAKHNLVVEGTSDYAYLRIISDHLASLSGRTSLDARWSIVPVGGADAVPTFVVLLGSHLDVTVLLDSRKEGHQRLNKLSKDGYLNKKRIILIGEVLGRTTGDIEDLFEIDEYLELYNKAFGAAVTKAQLVGNDPIVARIARLMNVDRFDHGRPADILLRERDGFLKKISDATLKRFEGLFERINKTI